MNVISVEGLADIVLLYCTPLLDRDATKHSNIFLLAPLVRKAHWLPSRSPSGRGETISTKYCCIALVDVVTCISESGMGFLRLSDVPLLL